MNPEFTSDGADATDQTAATFSAKAKDLQALRDAVVEAASVGGGLWLSYIFAFLYLTIATGAVTHKDLFLESPVKLPFLNVELPLLGFFVLGPLLFVVLHAYTLLHFTLLADKIGAFHTELQEQITDDQTRARLRRQLPSNIFVQFLSGPEDIRHGAVGWMLRWIARLSLVLGPILLLVFFELQFLPYHSELISWWQRLLILADLILLWTLWPSIAVGSRVSLRWRDLRRVRVTAYLALSLVPLLLVFTIATFTGEWLDDHLPSVGFPAPWTAEKQNQLTSLHELLVAGEIDYVRQRPLSVWSNRLVLPGIDVIDHAKFDSDAKFAAISATVLLRGRHLEGAILINAGLRKADFTGAFLDEADFLNADLRETKFECAQAGSATVCARLQGASLMLAQLQGASLNGAQLQGASLMFAQLQGASLIFARLQGASLIFARLQGASLNGAELQGSSFDAAELQGSSLDRARLQGASLNGAQLQGASLNGAQLQGAELDRAQLQGASLNGAQLQAASLDHALLWRTQTARLDAAGARILGSDFERRGADCPTGQESCDFTSASFAQLKTQIETVVPADSRVRTFKPRSDALARIARLDPDDKTIDEDLKPSTRQWIELANASPSDDDYQKGLADILHQIGCAADGAPYVSRRLIYPLQNRFTLGNPQPAVLARAFLEGQTVPGRAGCPKKTNDDFTRLKKRLRRPPRRPNRDRSSARYPMNGCGHAILTR
jgi:uncharacterized protein YjbI with pentapeptide repeats